RQPGAAPQTSVSGCPATSSLAGQTPDIPGEQTTPEPSALQPKVPAPLPRPTPTVQGCPLVGKVSSTDMSQVLSAQSHFSTGMEAETMSERRAVSSAGAFARRAGPGPPARGVGF